MGRGSRSVVLSVPTMLHSWLHWSQDGTDHEKKHQPEVICCPEKQSWGRPSHAHDRNYCWQFTLSPMYNVPKTLPNTLFICALIGQGLVSLTFNNVTKTRGWANCRRWRTGKTSVLQSMGSQRVGYDWVKEQQQPRQRIFLYLILGFFY